MLQSLRARSRSVKEMVGLCGHGRRQGQDMAGGQELL
jgi:hypothetical protein